MAAYGRERRRNRRRQRGHGRGPRTHAQRRRPQGQDRHSGQRVRGIGQNKAKVLHLFIRRGVAQAKFSVQELREMEKLPGVQLIINEDDFDLDDETIEVAGKDKLTRQMVEELFAIREMAEDMEDDATSTSKATRPTESTTCTSTPPPPRSSARTARSRPSAWSAPKPVPTARCTAPASSPTTRLRPSTTPSATSPPKPPVSPTTSTAPTWPTPTATAASPPSRRRQSARPPVRHRLGQAWSGRLIGSTKSDALLIVTNMLEDLSKRRRRSRGR